MDFLRANCSWGLSFYLLLLASTSPLPAGTSSRSPSEDSGGVLISEQAAYDVQHYELDLRVDPTQKYIAGTATLEVKVLKPISFLVLDLDPRLRVERVRVGGSHLKGRGGKTSFERRGGKLWISLNRVAAPSSRITAVIDYEGHPREAVNAPWDGGFTWSKTKSGEPWIATSVQCEGADLWWPCKDHPSDEPESFTLRIRVPKPLVVASNGRLVRVLENRDRTRTYVWHTAFPINNYCVALNIAPYETITTNYTSVSGETVPLTYWVLPENKARGQWLLSELRRDVNFYERVLGPYPFRSEKCGVAETPYLGMEHQTIIAYGNQYRVDPQGYDWLLHHELGHEWFGNLVTAEDWRHFWLHEGLCTYMQALFTEEREGATAYHHALDDYRRKISSRYLMVADQPTSMQQIEETSGLDAYYKGAWIIHTVRYLIGKERTLQLLRRFLYPTSDWEKRTDGTPCRFVSTDDFVKLACVVSGQDLGWLFNLYLKQPKLPGLVSEIKDNRLLLRWDTPEGFPFPMPVEVEVNGQIERIPMPEGKAELDLSRYAHCRLDPQGWILKASGSTVVHSDSAQ